MKNKSGSCSIYVIIGVIIVAAVAVAAVIILYPKTKPATDYQPEGISPTSTPSPTAPAAASYPSGKWTGTWTNSLGEHGNETLEISDGTEGNFSGLWSGSINISGKWTGRSSMNFSGKTDTRSYEAEGTILGNTLTIKYTATRLNSSGTYTGEEKLTHVQ
jgi:hypothetical protein